MKRLHGSKKTKTRKPAAQRANRADRTSPGVESSPRIGLEAAIQRAIPREWTLAHYDPRLPAVLSTPAMIGMMEVAAAEAVRSELPAGAITVGTRIEVDHLKAVPEETLVRARARLAEHKGRFMIFEVEASAGEHVIGRGRVYRAIVEPEKFHARARTRKA